MSDKNILSAQLRSDSPLNERFQEFQTAEGFESRSEAVRSALRLGLDEYHSDDEPQRAATDELLLSTASNLATVTVVVGLLAFIGLASPSTAVLAGGSSLVVGAIFVVEVARRPVRRLGAAVRRLNIDDDAVGEVSD